MLRRVMYLAIKEMSTMASDVIIVTSSLTEDMTGKEDSNRRKFDQRRRRRVTNT